ncbi:hypothetical protein [Deinococcus koreensis]|uniref:Uncharacterized protein n=1 Tax=Deinococcus koreensis TaxID=2054903 RepID=A0A2K3UX13_9DEIO|nr:hypothetical protein CVO96_06485 [Deinococcus koreensis]
MTRNDDDRSANPPLSGPTGAQTGGNAPEPQAVQQGAYATTPADDRVGAADHGKYEPVEVPPAKAVTGQFDHLATRDVSAMEHSLQTPEFAGAETVAPLGGEGTALDGVMPSGGLGLGVSPAEAVRHHLADANLNPGYTPPSLQGPPHVSQRPADLPEGETAELQSEVQGGGPERR